MTKLLDKPGIAEEVREILREYYAQLKACDEYLSFVFVTGITKFIQGSLYSAFNNPTDISFNPKFGALTGFTQTEIEHYYARELLEVAENLNVSREELLVELKDYYDGFCFDGETSVYNPFSMQQFLEVKRFQNFWFNTGTPEQLMSYFREKHLTFGDFRNVEVDQERLMNPSQNRFEDPPVYLYQLGYLSLKSKLSKTDIILDYPNTEVRESMARHLLYSYFTPPMAGQVCKRLKRALSERNPALLVNEINLLLSQIPYDYYATGKRDEFFYCNAIFTLFYAIGADVEAEKHGNFGRADFVVKSEDQSWVIEMKVSHDDKDSQKLAEAAITQIKENNYGGGYLNPVLLGLVIDDNARVIKVWAVEDSSAAKPDEHETAQPRPRL